jgi:hypothetical protein
MADDFVMKLGGHWVQAHGFVGRIFDLDVLGKGFALSLELLDLAAAFSSMPCCSWPLLAPISLDLLRFHFLGQLDFCKIGAVRG